MSKGKSSSRCDEVKYSEPVVFTYPGAVVTIYSPILTDEERRVRMARIAESARRLLIDKIGN